MKSTWNIAVVMMVAGALAIGCEKSSETGDGEATKGAGDMLNSVAESGGDAMKSAGNSVGDLGDMATNAMDTVVTPIQEQLSQYAGKINQLKSKASIVANADLTALVNDASAKYDEIKQKVDAAMGGDTAAIDALKADGTAMMSELKSLFDQAMAKLTELSNRGG